MATSPLDVRSALILVDIQQAFQHPTFWGSSRSTPQFEDNIPRLLSAFRKAAARKDGNADADVLIVHIKHTSLSPGSILNPSNPNSEKGHDFMTIAQPLEGEMIIEKHVNSAFIGTDLENILRKLKVQRLFICGLTTDHCVSTTTRMAANLGWRNAPQTPGHVEGGNVLLIEDACATHNRDDLDAESMHKAGLASLRNEFADIIRTDHAIAMISGGLS